MNNRRQNFKKARYTFAIAEMHYRGANILLEKESEDSVDSEPSLLPPGYALFSLALELYLKAIQIENGKKPWGHDLFKLFEGLDERTKKIIKDRHEKLFNDTDWGKAVKSNYPDKDFSLKGVLEEAKDGFETWRYFHEVSLEKRQKMISFNLYEAATAIRAFLLFQYPNWEEINNDEIIGEKVNLPMPE